MTDPADISLTRQITLQMTLEDFRALVSGIDSYFKSLCRYLGTSRSDLATLRLLAQQDEDKITSSPTQLATELGLSNAAMSSVLDRLEEAGHLERLRDTKDRRRRIIHLKEASKHLAHDIFLPLDARILSMLEVFSAKELEVVESALQQITYAIQDANKEVEEPNFVLLNYDEFS